MLRAALLTCGVLLALAAPGGAQEPLPALLGINSANGRIDLGALAVDGARVAFFEEVAGERKPLATVVVSQPSVEFPFASVPGIATWRCDRTERRFLAVVTAPDGRTSTAANEARTPSCRDRLEVVVERRIARGARLAVTVSDRFELGGTRARVCAGPRGGRSVCKLVTLTPAALSTEVHFRTAGDAVWRVRVRHEGGTLERLLSVGRASLPARTGLTPLLVTGDSLVQGLDAFVSDRLATAFETASDAHPATGLVKPGLSWPALARRQVATRRPEVTVLSLGLNDQQPIGGVACCGPAWIAAYARKARSLMRTYVQSGKADLLWMTVPIPRDPRFAEAARAVNTALRQAAPGQDGVLLVEVDELLTPGGRYRDDMRIDGRLQRVRDPDGIHYTVAGQRLVAGAVAGALKALRPTG